MDYGWSLTDSPFKIRLFIQMHYFLFQGDVAWVEPVTWTDEELGIDEDTSAYRH